MGTKIIGKNGSVCLDSSYNVDCGDVKILTLTQQNFKTFGVEPKLGPEEEGGKVESKMICYFED